MSTIDIVIPSYNGRELLEKQLPVVFKHSPKINKVILVNDASSDDTIKFVRKSFPKVDILTNTQNQGFTRSVNKGVAHSRADFVVLLNNDVYPHKDYLKEALKHFDDPQVFGVTFNELHSSWPHVSWKGKLHFTQGEDKTKPRLSAWASGGSCLLSRRIWVSLDGMNPIYSPGYWEDIDLGWRAWKAGYKIIWEPEAQVEHIHQSTFDKLNPRFVSDLKERNELLFLWQNISDLSLLLSHLAFLFKQVLFHPGYLRIIFQALKLFPQARVTTQQTYTDREILARVNTPLYD